jgi:hypothetical protein
VPKKQLQIGHEAFQNMREREAKVMSKLKMFNLISHPEVENWKRAILIDWVMEVCSEFLLQRKTFHLAVTYIDM